MKKLLLLFIVSLLILAFGCAKSDPEIDDPVTDSVCRDQPLSEACYTPSSDLDHISPTPEEFLINETFDDERTGSSPRNWLLYSNEEYALNGVRATIVEETSGNRFVSMFSDGLKAPMYPQSAPNPTLIFTTKFNLDIARRGIAMFKVMIPSDAQANSMSVGLSTGAVNTLSIVIDRQQSLSIKVGGPFFYYSGTGDGGDLIPTAIVLEKDVWHHFKMTWDATADLVSVSRILIEEDMVREILIHQDVFHISNRLNALLSGTIFVPNVFKVTMPRYQSGYGYLDDVVVERMGDV